MKLIELFEEKQKSLLGMMIDNDGKISKMSDFDKKHSRKGGHDGVFITSVNQLKKWDKKFDCSYKDLESLKGSPREVESDFDCHKNELQNLEGGPDIVHGSFNCNNNKITSLVGAPSFIGMNFECKNNALTSLKDVHKHVKKFGPVGNGGNTGYFSAKENPIKSHVLGILLIENCHSFSCDEKTVTEIINKYLPNDKGHKAVIACEAELIEAGFEDFAQI